MGEAEAKAETGSKGGLTDRQALFVRHYLVDPNATRAAISAGFSRRTAKQQGSRLLTNVDVAAAIDAARKKQTDKLEIKADDVLRELHRVGMVDISQAFDEHGRLLEIQKMPEDLRRAISGFDIEVDQDGNAVRKVRFHSKISALESLGKHLKLFADRKEIDLGPNLLALLNASFEPEPEGAP